MTRQTMIEIPFDVYQDMLGNRRKQIKDSFGWEIPNAVWDYAMEMLEECGISPEYADPSYVVDNLAVNGDYEPIENLDDYAQEVEDRKEEIANGDIDEEDIKKDLAQQLERSGEYMAVVYDNYEDTYYLIRSL